MTRFRRFNSRLTLPFDPRGIALCAALLLSPLSPAGAQTPDEPPEAASPPVRRQEPEFRLCRDRHAPPKEAIRACEQALALPALTDPERGLLHARLGSLWRGAHQYPRAIAEFDEALKFVTRKDAVLNNRGWAKADKGDLDGAMADYSEAIRLQPKNFWAYNNRGNVFLNRGDLDRAIADYDVALTLKDFALGHTNRGRAYTFKNDFDRAQADFDQALRLEPGFELALRSRCRLRSLRRQFAAALADCNAVLAVSPNSVNLTTLRGDVRRAAGDLNAALADYDRALSMGPNYVPAYVGRAQLFEQRGEAARARADYRSAAFALTRFDDLETAQARVLARERLNILNKAQAPVAPGRRVALVIGNSAYKNVAALDNPARDAQMIAATLRATGFQSVTVADDLTRDRFFEALRAFAAQAEQADWAVVYYAGHGMEVGGVNYLVPVDAKLKTDRDAAGEAVALEQVIASVQGARKLKLVMLDACRDNPFAQKMQRSLALRLVNKALANIEPDAGFMVVYGAKAGETALDGEGARNSPFATAVARNLRTPGLEVRKLFDIVRDDVLAATKKQQQPFSYGSLPGREDFFFVAAK